MENGMKNGEFPNKETQFTPENQPSPEAKSKGWERRREAQKIMDEIMQLADMPYADIKALLEDIKVHPEKHTLREVKLAQYLMDKKYTVDYLDRHISKAPQEIVMGGDMELKITREIINEPKD
jgi:pyocin large subunit-like protein